MGPYLIAFLIKFLIKGYPPLVLSFIPDFLLPKRKIRGDSMDWREIENNQIIRRTISLMIKQVSQIAIPVKKMERAVQFYKEHLELKLLFETNQMAFFDCNGLRLLLSIPEKETFAHASSVLYFEVSHIEKSYERLMKNGVIFISKPHLVAKTDDVETWMAFFEDSEQNTHAIMSEVLTK